MKLFRGLATFIGISIVAIAVVTNVAHAQETVLGQIASQVATSWPWYVVRASGFVAAGSLLLLMLSGIGFITGHSFAFLDPLLGWATHRALGFALTVSLLVHIFALLFDHFVSFNLVGLFVPFASDYKVVTVGNLSFGSLNLAFGIFAFYAVLLIMATSLYWMDNKPLAWRLIHFLSYPTLLLAYLHGLFLGTDLAGGFLRWLWIVGGILLLGALIARLWRAGTLKRTE